MHSQIIYKFVGIYVSKDKKYILLLTEIVLCAYILKCLTPFLWDKWYVTVLSKETLISNEKYFGIIYQ